MNIWGLFDSGNSCYKKAVYEYNSQWGGQHYITSIGIDRENKNSDFINQDLAINTLFDDKALFEKLDMVDRPDVILASPPCESWSIASAMKNGNACWKKEFNTATSLFGDIQASSKFTIREHRDYERYQYKYGKSFLTRINGEMCTYNMVQIIERYKPKIFIIENPMQSRIWEYLEDVIGFKLPHKNRTYYSDYGYIIQKPTIFASNINLGLRNNKTATELAFKDIKSNGNGRYNERSNIPNELIFDMIRKCERKLNESRII